MMTTAAANTPHEAFSKRLVETPAPHDTERAKSLLQDIIDGLRDDDQRSRLQALLAETMVTDLVLGTLGCSPYLTGLIRQEPARLLRILECVPERYMAELIEKLGRDVTGAANLSEAMPLLRRFKSEMALLIALCDLGGVWPIMTVTAALTATADAAVSACVGFLFAQAVAKGEWLADGEHPESQSGYIVIAMGKHGARELNYSSDIDLVVFYDPEKSRLKPGRELPMFFIRMTRDLVKLMQERTADGYVFRTDLRLRPDPGATQVAISFGSAMHYYETVGQNW
ncbi:MAG: bifunctional [glutamine synthetase] adenylyltransferase/[glutamine synthetase]-adenylyl-L-tyrosine phosphorylase, partial [Hyphomicrobiaceae bacterium]